MRIVRRSLARQRKRLRYHRKRRRRSIFGRRAGIRM